MKASTTGKIYITDARLHHLLLKEFVDTEYADKDVKIDWEYSGIGLYRIHVHQGDIPTISLKWEGL